MDNDLGGGANAYSLDLGDDTLQGGDLNDLLTDTSETDDTAVDTGTDGLRKANELLAKQLADTAKSLDEATKRQYDTSLQERPQAQPITAQPTVDPEKYAAQREALRMELAQQAITDPGGALLRVYDAAHRAAVQELESRGNKLATGTVNLEITNFRSQMASDPDFAVAGAEFDALLRQQGVAQSLASQTPEERKIALEFFYDAAATRGRKKAAASQNGRDRQPPLYSGGAAMERGTQVATTFKGKALNNVQKEIMRSCREAGITDNKRIKLMLDDAAEG